MSFDNWIGKSKNKKKEKRKPYRGSKAIDRTCRNHCGCCWCLENRTYSYNKEKQKADSKLKDYNEEKES